MTRCAGLLFAFALLVGGCATTPGGSDTLGWKRLSEVRSLIKRHYVADIDERALTHAAIKAMVRAAPSGARISPTLVHAAEKADVRDERDALTALIGSIAEQPGAPSIDSLWETGVRAMVASLDPLCSYIDAKEHEEARIPTEKIGAVGMHLQKRGDDILVLGPTGDTPARASGIKPGDVLVAIDGVAATGSLGSAVKRLRGEPGSRVKLTLRRAGEMYEVVVVRAAGLTTVDSMLLDGNIAYIRFTHFGADAFRLLGEHLRGLGAGPEPKVRGVILDLRDNSGGLLNGAIALADRFLTDKVAIVSTEGRDPASRMRFVANVKTDAWSTSVPIVVLVNAQTASGAEMVAAALQDHGRAKIVGTSTFGSGSIQTLYALAGNSLLKLTTAYMIRPNGERLHDRPVVPDICVGPTGVRSIPNAARPMSPDQTRALCPNHSQRYDIDQDDAELKEALNMLRGPKRPALPQGRSTMRTTEPGA